MMSVLPVLCPRDRIVCMLISEDMHQQGQEAIRIQVSLWPLQELVFQQALRFFLVLLISGDHNKAEDTAF
jgi:hypothetical protein